jgi:hypothetical protein
MWFTEHHPDMCSIGPTERWLEHAAWRFNHDMASDRELYTGISGNFLREYATHAVRDHIVDEMNIILGWDTQIRVYPILDTVLGVSKTREEGAWPRGEMLFVEHRSLGELGMPVRFPEQERPRNENFKHVRKLLLAVEQSDRRLVSDGQRIIGIAEGKLPSFYIKADFRGSHGFLGLSSGPVCSFSDGSFRSSTHQAKLVQLEEALLGSDLDRSDGNTLFRIVAALVHRAETEKRGCALVVDLNREPMRISGQKLEYRLDLRQPALLDLAHSLSKLDGALHIGADLHLHGFGCLMDGHAIASEDRSRGARYNSALRFTAENRNILVVVVSADRPVAVIQQGLEISARCPFHPVDVCAVGPLPLTSWIEGVN